MLALFGYVARIRKVKLSFNAVGILQSSLVQDLESDTVSLEKGKQWLLLVQLSLEDSRVMVFS